MKLYSTLHDHMNYYVIFIVLLILLNSYFVCLLVIAVEVFCCYVVFVVLGVITVLEICGIIKTTCAQMDEDDSDAKWLGGVLVAASLFGLCYGIFWIPCLCCMSCGYDGCERFHSRRARGICSLLFCIYMMVVILPFVVLHLLQDNTHCPVSTGAVITSIVMCAIFSIQLLLCGCEILHILYMFLTSILKCVCRVCESLWVLETRWHNHASDANTLNLISLIYLEFFFCIIQSYDGCSYFL